MDSYGVQQDCKDSKQATVDGLGLDGRVLVKRVLEVQLSEVSDETCDRETAAFFSAVNDQARTAGSPSVKRHKRLPYAADMAPASAAGHGDSITGNGAVAAAFSTPIRFPQPLMGPLSTPMGPPAPALGSLLLAARMASGTNACSTGGQGDRNSPLLPATLATLQATTASVVAAEVLAAVIRPAAAAVPGAVGMGSGTAEVVAGWLAGNSCTTIAAAAASAEPAQQRDARAMQAHALQEEASQPCIAAGPAAAVTAMEVDYVLAGLPAPQDMSAQRPAGAGPTELLSPAAVLATTYAAAAQASRGTPAPSEAEATATAAHDTASLAPVAAAEEEANATPPAPAAAKPQLPSWLCKPSAELAASQAICKASLLSTTAALARLSSPRGHTIAHSVAAAAAAGSMCAPPGTAFCTTGPNWPGGAADAAGLFTSPGAASVQVPWALGQASDTAAAVAHTAAPSSLAEPSLLGSPWAVKQSTAAAGQGRVVIGTPAEAPTPNGMVWGMPFGPAAGSAGGILAAAAAAQTEGLQALSPLKIVAPFAAPGDCVGEAAEVDASSCSSSPKACTHAAGTLAGSALDKAAATVAAAAARLIRSGRQQARDEENVAQALSLQCCGSISPGDSVSLTADDASSPVNESMSSLVGADVADSGAVFVHVDIKRATGACAAVPAAKEC